MCVTLHVSVWVEIPDTIDEQVMNFVTLHVSVWVEICKEFYKNFKYPCHAPRERVSWNPPRKIRLRLSEVTLHVSVWVEMLATTFPFSSTLKSRSTWACELKCSHALVFRLKHAVTLHVSVWVEIYLLISNSQILPSRSTWACELKWQIPYIACPFQRHAPRERVSWNSSFRHTCLCGVGHAPRERVSWNAIGCPWVSVIAVTLHVSVWVEMVSSSEFSQRYLSRSTWACELKLPVRQKYFKTYWSRSTWACELKLHNKAIYAFYALSRSTWACELKLPVRQKYFKTYCHAPRERVSWNCWR